MDEELKHYGILGMKWGVRRTPEQLGHDVKDMSDDELRKVANRAQLEAQYTNAMKQLHPEEKEGRVMKFLKDTVESGAKAFSQKWINTRVENFFKAPDKFDISDLLFDDLDKISPDKISLANKWFSSRKVYEKSIEELFDEYKGPANQDIVDALFG